MSTAAIRHDWTDAEIGTLFAMPFIDLVFRALTIHRQHHDPNRVEQAALLSIKTGACPEDCAYCPQSARYATGLKAERLMALSQVVAAASDAKANGATRFCMGAAWRSPKDKDLIAVAEMIGAVRALGLETCATLGMLTPAQAATLKAAGLDWYNHNLDTSAEYYDEIISTRTFDDRLETLAAVREAGINVCAGGIVGMGESRADRAGFIGALARLPAHPGSVPINRLVRVAGTPLADAAELDPFEFVRTIAVARITMPASVVRLSAGRETMSDELQALCFLAGANSIFHGERLLTTPNPEADRDRALFERLGIVAAAVTRADASMPAVPGPAACAGARVQTAAA